MTNSKSLCELRKWLKRKSKKIKDISKEIFGEAGIESHKQNSNVKKLEKTQEEHSFKLSYAKQKFGTCPTDRKMLVIPWDKSKDINSKKTRKRRYVETLCMYFQPT